MSEENLPQSAKKRTVVFVCTGNTCRSPMAEGLAKRIFEDVKSGQGAYSFVSRGLSVINGKVSENSLEAMKEKGIDIEDITPRLLADGDVAEAYIILAMTKSHKQYILERYSHISDIDKKVFALCEYANGNDGDISDPFGLRLDAYRECAAEIEACVKEVIEKLIN